MLEMHMIRKYNVPAKLHLLVSSLFLLALSGFGTNAVAENSRVFGDYVVHYNAFRSDALSPEVAKAYELTRRNNRILINITVLKKVLGTTGKPVHATISGHASNLTGQKRDVNLREVREGTAIYYIGDFPITHEEVLRFTVTVKPEGQADTYEVKFKQQFFTE